MLVWTFTCGCGADSDYRSLAQAKKEAKKHLKHKGNENGVYVDQTETHPEPFDDYLTGKYFVVKK